MVKQLSIGVIGIQGAVSEHIFSMKKALEESNITGEVFVIKNNKQIDTIDALIIPGGESSTISKILEKSGLYDVILKRINKHNLSVMGTCAGCVLLASVLDPKDDIKLFKAVDMNVQRNAFGPQKESFEKTINIKGFKKPFNAVFIRAPIIKKVWGKCKILAEIDKKIIMARQDNILALSFHPELTDDLSIHKYFLSMI